MSIGNICNRSIRANQVTRECQSKVTDYCNKYAQKITGNARFEFDELPDDIVEAVFYGFGSVNTKWSSYLKRSVRDELERLGHGL